MGLKKTILGERSTQLFIDVKDFPAKDINGGDLYYQGWIAEVCPPGEEEFEVIPAAYLDATIQDDGQVPGQISSNNVIQHPKRAVAFDVERFSRDRMVPIDGVWTITTRHISIAGVAGPQSPYNKFPLDLSRPAGTGVMPQVIPAPVSGASVHL